VESYLHHQGSVFSRRFDANSYLYVTRALDYFDLSKNGSLEEGFAGVGAGVRFLVVSVSSDWLYPPYQSEEVAKALAAAGASVEYSEIRSGYGHDAFLLEHGQLTYLIRRFFGSVLVRDVMTAGAQAVGEEASLDDAARLMIRAGVNHLPVLAADGRLAGIVTSWDMARAVACNLGRLEEVMSRPVVTALPDEEVGEAARRMEEHDISALPVVDGEGGVIGMVTSDRMNALVGGSA
jgi:homoserine O-acetyltransferase